MGDERGGKKGEGKERKTKERRKIKRKKERNEGWMPPTPKPKVRAGDESF